MRIGIIGGGQLCKMLIEEANRWNVECAYLDPTPDCPASLVNTNGIVGSLHSEQAIRELSQKCDVLTYEIENINTNALQLLEQEGKTIIPSAETLKFIQDKGLQKLFYSKHNIPTANYFIVNDKQDFMQKYIEIKSDKVVVKSRTGGYDGKGVSIVSKQEIANGNIPFNGENVVLEECVNFSKEISVIVARDLQNNISVFPPVEMEFDPVGNLVKFIFSPTTLSPENSKQACDIAVEIVENMRASGLFAVEMMLDYEGNIFVNEVAPRPHNSGHHTIECCYTSQYEQLLRVLLGKPLGSTGLIQCGGMVNIIGSEGFEGEYIIEGEDEALKIEGVYFHLYGKKKSKHFRKLGHITLLANNLQELREKASRLEEIVKVVAKKI